MNYQIDSLFVDLSIKATEQAIQNANEHPVFTLVQPILYFAIGWAIRFFEKRRLRKKGVLVDKMFDINEQNKF